MKNPLANIQNNARNQFYTSVLSPLW